MSQTTALIKAQENAYQVLAAASETLDYYNSSVDQVIAAIDGFVANGEANNLQYFVHQRSLISKSIMTHQLHTIQSAVAQLDKCLRHYFSNVFEFAQWNTQQNQTQLTSENHAETTLDNNKDSFGKREQKISVGTLRSLGSQKATLLHLKMRLLAVAGEIEQHQERLIAKMESQEVFETLLKCK